MADLSADSEFRPLYEVKADLFKGLAHPLRIRILDGGTAGAGDVGEIALQGPAR